MKHCCSRTDTVMTAKMRPESCGNELAEQNRSESKRCDFLKNLTVASSLLICMVMLRGGAVPSVSSTVDAVLASAKHDTLLDDQLGRLTFVDALFPEAVLVFGESIIHEVAMPVDAAALIHPWSANEPYAAWTCSGTDVFAGITGEVTGVYHGMNEEMIVQITNDAQTSCIAGNLKQVSVSTGDSVEKGDLIGKIQKGSYCTFEVHQDGRSIDPTLMLEAR